jgi:hypothetical protein
MLDTGSDNSYLSQDIFKKIEKEYYVIGSKQKIKLANTDSMEVDIIQISLKSIYSNVIIKFNVGNYIDDIFVYSETYEEHVLLVNEVIKRLNSQDLKINL